VVATLAEVILPVITALLSHFWDLSAWTTRSIPCNYYGNLSPLLSLDADTVLPHSSLGRATVTIIPEAALNLVTLLSPRHSLYGGGHTSPPVTLACLEEIPEEGPLTPSPPSITSLRDWTYLLLTHTHEEFASLATLQNGHTCPPCGDISGVAFLHPSQIHHYIYEGWQGTLEIQECLDGIFKILQLDPSISLI